MKNQKGITLVALIITIIVMLILAGVSISLVVGDSGVLTQAQNTKYEQEKAAFTEAINLAFADLIMTHYSNTTKGSETYTTDKLATAIFNNANGMIKRAEDVTVSSDFKTISWTGSDSKTYTASIVGVTAGSYPFRPTSVSVSY